MSDENRDELKPEELEDQLGEALPDREAMSILPIGDAGVMPPVMDPSVE